MRRSREAVFLLSHSRRRREGDARVHPTESLAMPAWLQDRRTGLRVRVLDSTLLQDWKTGKRVCCEERKTGDRAHGYIREEASRRSALKGVNDLNIQ